jgi:hypothetical protein
MGGTSGTGGTLTPVPQRKRPSFHLFRPFHQKNSEGRTAQFCGGTASTKDDAFDIAERAAIALELGGVPAAYAEAWARFQIRKPAHVVEVDWPRALEDAGRFLDEWGTLAFEFGWRAADIFGEGGLAWFCCGERVRALGPDNAVTVSGRIFTRQNSATEGLG